MRDLVLEGRRKKNNSLTWGVENFELQKDRTKVMKPLGQGKFKIIASFPFKENTLTFNPREKNIGEISLKLTFHS
jgi:hypothetical protein